MENYRLPKTVFYSELASGKRKSGGQYLRYKDVFKRHLKACKLPVKGWENFAQLKSDWRFRVKEGIKCFEDTRLLDLDARRQLRKTRPKITYNYTYNSAGQLYCPTCDRTFKQKFRFASHIRAHARNA